MKPLSERDRRKLRDHLERKGRMHVLKDPSTRAIYTEAEKTDIRRKGFLQSLADLCVVGGEVGLSQQDIIECLRGAIEGMERV